MALTQLALLLSFVVCQQLAGAALSLPSLEPVSGPTAAAGNVCGGCYVVADVAGIVFGDETVTQTHTILTSIGVGKNGTNVTRTSFIEGTAQFTFNTASVVGTPAATSFDYAPTITYSGVALTSPTVYNVFTAYSVTSTTLDANGNCAVAPGTSVAVSPAFSVPRPSNVDAGQFALAADSSFVAYIGALTCSPGSVNAFTTSHFQISNLTTFATTTGPLRLTPQPVVSAAASTTPPTTAPPTTVAVTVAETTTGTIPASTTSLTSSTVTTALTIGTVVVVGNTTIQPSGTGGLATLILFTGQGSRWHDGSVGLLLWSVAMTTVAAVMWSL